MFNFLKRQSSNKKVPKNKKKLKLFLSIFLILTITGVLFFLNLSVLIVKNVVVKEGVSCVEEDRVVKDGAFFNQNIIFLNKSLIEKKLKEKYLCIDSLNLEKKYPDTLNIYLKERQKALRIGIIKGESFIKLPEITEATPSSQSAFFTIDLSVNEASVSGIYITDKNGFVFNAGEETSDIPTIYLVGYEVGLGRRVDRDIVNLSIKLINRLEELSIEYKTVKIMGDMVLIDGDLKLTFSLAKDLNRQLASLQLILQKAKMNSKSMEKIDLRFEKPIVVYSQKGRN